MEHYKIKAKTREVSGKKVKKIREAAELPVVLYGHGVEPRMLTFNTSEFTKLYNEAGSSSLIEVTVDDAKEPLNVLLHQVDMHPYSDNIIHADLLQVKLNEKITAEVPLVLVGEEDAPVVKEKDGSIVLNKDSVQMEAFPQDLLPEIEVDVTALTDFDQNILVKDLKIPGNVTILDDPEDVVVLIQEPRSEEEMAELDAEVVADVDTVEVEEKGKDEEEGEESDSDDKDKKDDKKEKSE